MNPKVSILMNCFNGEEFLQDALESIFAQTYSNYEIIFIDNHSTDNSINIANTFKDPRLVIRSTPEHCNIGKARSFGSQFFSGKYLAFLDVDDLWVPTKLAKQVKLMEDQNLVLTYGGAQTIDENNIVLSAFSPYSSSTVSFGKLLFNYNINQQTVMINLEEEPVQFLESKTYAPDNPLFMSIIGRNEKRCAIINEHLVDYRLHSTQMSKGLLSVRYKEGLDTLLDLKKMFPNHAKNYKLHFLLALGKKGIQTVISKIFSFFARR